MGRIYANTGAMTPWVTAETADGMSLGKIGSIIDALRAERYRWSPVSKHSALPAWGELVGLTVWGVDLHWKRNAR